MKPMAKTLLRRFLLTLSGIAVWAKALAAGSADEQTRSVPETDQKTAGVADSKSPTVNHSGSAFGTKQTFQPSRSMSAFREP
jgi:hypothetical protein